MNFDRMPGCFWIFLILLFIGGPQLVGKMLVGMIFFAILGLFLFTVGGSLLFRTLTMNSYLRNQTEAHNTFANYLIKFMVQMAKAHGEAEQAEIALIGNFFRLHMRYGPSQMLWVNRLIHDALHQEERIPELCQEFSRVFGLQEQRILIQLLYQVALADGAVQESEQRLLDEIVSLLQFPDTEHQTIRRLIFRESGGESPMKILGLADSASAAEIKKRYRELSKENHPDLVAHLGEEFKAVAEERMVKINQAYEQLKKQGRV